MTMWLVILVAGVLTFVIRLSFIVLLERIVVPAWLERALQFVPVAVLSAIIVPEVLQPGGALDLSFGNARLLAAVLAVIVAWRTKNTLLTIAAGMIGLFAFRFVFGG